MSGLESVDVVHGAALVLIVAAIVLIYFVAAGLGGFLPALRVRRSRTPYEHFRFENNYRPDLSDVGQQMHAVMGASFQMRKLLSRSE